MAAPLNVYMINYFPVTGGSAGMWVNYSHSQSLTDLQLAKNVGFNTIRVFIQSNNQGAFNFYTPTAGQLANLTDFYNCAKTVGVKLHLTLFDSWGNYGQISHSQSFVSNILSALPDFTALQCIEIQNETPFNSTSSYTGGFDNGWPVGTPQYSTIGPVTIVWAQNIIPYIRTVAPGVPVTGSGRGVSTTYDGIADVGAFYNGVHGTAAEPDWYEWHCYVPNDIIGLVMQHLQLAIVAVGGNPANLFIGETGVPSPALGTQSTAQGYEKQNDYLHYVRWCCQELGLPEPAPWILYDLIPNAYGWNGYQYMGLYDVSSVAKPIVQQYQKYPLGSRMPTITLNTTITGATSTDGNGNILPPRWFIYKGNSSNQPIVVTLDASTRYLGNPTLLLTGSSATLASPENPPALECRPITWPVISGGGTYTFQVIMKGTGSLGQPKISISWYNANLAPFISTTSSLILSLTSNFATYAISGTAPNNATYARLFINVGYNAGSIWVAGAGWAGPNGRFISVGGNRYRR